MFLAKWPSVVFSVFSLAFLAAAEPPAPGTVEKLIEKLGADDFRTRQQASEALEKLGAPALPALRKAHAAPHPLEVKRRIEMSIARIETDQLRSEEKRWDDLDEASRSIKDRLVRVLEKTPALTDRQVTTAIYLLTATRLPTTEEADRAEKQLTQANGRRTGILEVARELVKGKEFRAEVAAANLRLMKLQKELAGEDNLAAMLARLNNPPLADLPAAIATPLEKRIKAEDQLTDLAFLLMMSRSPTAVETKSVADHLKKATDRSKATGDVVWALMNSNEFVLVK